MNRTQRGLFLFFGCAYMFASGHQCCYQKKPSRACCSSAVSADTKRKEQFKVLVKKVIAGCGQPATRSAVISFVDVLLPKIEKIVQCVLEDAQLDKNQVALAKQTLKNIGELINARQAVAMLDLKGLYEKELSMRIEQEMHRRLGDVLQKKKKREQKFSAPPPGCFLRAEDINLGGSDSVLPRSFFEADLSGYEDVVDDIIKTEGERLAPDSRFDPVRKVEALESEINLLVEVMEETIPELEELINECVLQCAQAFFARRAAEQIALQI